MSAIGINLSLGNPVDHIGKIESIDFSVIDRGATLVTEVRIKDNDTNFRLVINLNDKPHNIINNLQRQTREIGLQELEKDALMNLLLLQAQNLLISDTIKENLRAIEAFEVSKVVSTEEYQQKISESSLSPKETLHVFANEASKVASMIETKIHQSFERLNERIGKLNFDVFERTEPIEEAKKQLIDNLQKQYVLVVNTQYEILNLQPRPNETQYEYAERVRAAVPTHDLAERVKEIINSL